MSDAPTFVEIHFNPDRQSGTFSVDQEGAKSAAWTRVKLTVRSRQYEHRILDNSLQISWPDLLSVVRELGGRGTQSSLNFRFKPIGLAAEKIQSFSRQLSETRAQRSSLALAISSDEILSTLRARGFTRRELKPFQLRDLGRLLALSNGANFSVPGAGKTTVTFALHIMLRQPGHHLLVVAPKAATQAWKDIVDECMESDSPNLGSEPFTVLEGKEETIQRALTSGATRFIISYDLMVRQQSIIAGHFASVPTHVVLDESHRMKAGWLSQRGSFLLHVASLPIRRDILTGTPMPQAATDIESQLDFLWPGHGLGQEVVLGTSPREVLGNLYVRTTKTELGLKKPNRQYIDVSMDRGQLALYSIIRNEFLRDFSKKINAGLGESQLLRARRSVMRLLQLSVNPALALTAMANDDVQLNSAIADEVLDQGISSKMLAVMDHARNLASLGQKTVIWTIFTDTIHTLSAALADLNPVYVHGGVGSGDDSDPETREGRIRRFHEDDNCFVLIANPAAAGEGISLHTVCHNAIYVDRSYVSTHYLQSIDRIHRLGLPPDQDTNIFIYRSKAPAEIGSIDMSVSRRLAEKIRNMQKLLDDPDLHEVAFDEEEALDPIDYDVRIQDIVDLIAEMEGKATQNYSDEM